MRSNGRCAGSQGPACRLDLDDADRQRSVDMLTILLNTTKLYWRRQFRPSQSSNRTFGITEAIMDTNQSGRRRFLKQAAALAGVGVGAGVGTEWVARGQSAKPEVSAKDAHDPGEHLRRGTLPRRGVRMSVDHITFYTPLQDYG